MEKRIILLKEWARYKHKQYLEDTQMMDRIMYSQQHALDELRKESEELYQEAIQVALLKILILHLYKVYHFRLISNYCLIRVKDQL